MNFYKTLEYFPPLIVRLLARKSHGTGSRFHPIPLSNQEIADKGGLTLIKVVCMSESMDWSNYTIDEIKRYTHGCGIDLGNVNQMRRLKAYLRSKHKRFTYLKNSDQWAVLRPLIVKWQESLMNQ